MIIFHVLNTYHAPGTVLSTIALKLPSQATQTREDKTGFALRFARLQSLLFLAPSHDVTCQAGCETQATALSCWGNSLSVKYGGSGMGAERRPLLGIC